MGLFSLDENIARMTGKEIYKLLNEKQVREIVEELKVRKPNIVEVVRCKNCVYFNRRTDAAGQTEKWCSHYGSLYCASGNDFCSLAKEK